MKDMAETTRVEIPVKGMDCAGCARHVREAIAGVPGVRSAEVLLASERAVVELDAAHPANVDHIRRAVASAGYEAPVPEETAEEEGGTYRDVARRVLFLFGLVFGVVLLVAVVGEWLGVFESVQERIPWPAGAVFVGLIGWPIFRQVARAALQGKVIAHTLMMVGALAALVVGEWLTAAVVVFFMRVGDYVETYTTERARQSVRRLTQMAPQTARVERHGRELEVPVDEVRPGDMVIVRPGEQIPVDGEVVGGHAVIDQAAITGEPMPVDVAAGFSVFAATFAGGGALRLRATAVGRDTTFGRIIRLVEEAEANRGPVQRLADRFSAYYLPVVAAIAVLTFVLRGDLMATVAVLVVACSCAFALATPVALLASIGAAARRGQLIKGGRYLEALAKADVVLIDKTGTLTLGRPTITDILSLNGLPQDELLRLAASAERYSEHPLASAVRDAAQGRGLALAEPAQFEAIPGVGVRADVDGRQVTVGSARALAQPTTDGPVEALLQEGRTLLYVAVDGETVGVLAAADTVREEVPEAVERLRSLGLRHIELLTGDRAPAAAALAERLGIAYRAELLPEDKIAVVRAYQAQGRTVVMIGDGVNDAPALAQADVGIAMGAAGTDVAIEAAHVVLMRDDWRLVPELFEITHKTMRVIRLNIAFTAVYNLVGLSLAAFGLLPPVLAAAAQSLPDLGILANSARLLRQ